MRTVERKSSLAGGRVRVTLTRRTLHALSVLIAAAVLYPAMANAGVSPGLCLPGRPDTTRGKIPASFAVQACFDGKTLFVHNNLDVALGVAVDGAVGKPDRIKTDFGLAALATRAVSKDPLMLLPGDTLKFPIGPGAARAALRSTSTIGFYALARAVAPYIPLDATGVIDDFTAMIKDVDQAGHDYADCLLSAHKLAGRVRCKAVLARDAGVAVGKFIVHAGLSIVKRTAAKIGAVIVSTTEVSKWAYEQPGQVQGVVGSGTIKLARVEPPLVIRGAESYGGVPNPGTLAQAMNRLGQPSIMRGDSSGVDCRVSWRSLGIDALFQNFGATAPQPPCRPAASFNLSDVLITGGRWITDTGVRVGDPVSKLLSAYPDAQSPADCVTDNIFTVGVRWRLRREPDPNVMNSYICTLSALVNNGKVAGFELSNPGASE